MTVGYRRTTPLIFLRAVTWQSQHGVSTVVWARQHLLRDGRITPLRLAPSLSAHHLAVVTGPGVETVGKAITVLARPRRRKTRSRHFALSA